jgi:hypothetical protein
MPVNASLLEGERVPDMQDRIDFASPTAIGLWRGASTSFAARWRPVRNARAFSDYSESEHAP